MTSVGNAAPDFTLKNTSKDDVSLSDYAGKTVVLAFYPGAFTGVLAEVLTVVITGVLTRGPTGVRTGDSEEHSQEDSREHSQEDSQEYHTKA